jgi:hypothetical protein
MEVVYNRAKKMMAAGTFNPNSNAASNQSAKPQSSHGPKHSTDKQHHHQHSEKFNVEFNPRMSQGTSYGGWTGVSYQSSPRTSQQLLLNHIPSAMQSQKTITAPSKKVVEHESSKNGGGDNSIQHSININEDSIRLELNKLSNEFNNLIINYNNEITEEQDYSEIQGLIQAQLELLDEYLANWTNGSKAAVSVGVLKAIRNNEAKLLSIIKIVAKKVGDFRKEVEQVVDEYDEIVKENIALNEKLNEYESRISKNSNGCTSNPLAS